MTVRYNLTVQSMLSESMIINIFCEHKLKSQASDWSAKESIRILQPEQSFLATKL